MFSFVIFSVVTLALIMVLLSITMQHIHVTDENFHAESLRKIYCNIEPMVLGPQTRTNAFMAHI